MKITVETTIAAPVEVGWRAWTTPDDIRQWNAASQDWYCPAAEIDLRPGGQFSYRMEARDGSMGFDFAGTFTRVIANEVIEYSLGDERLVAVEFIAGDQSVTVRETFDAEPSHSAEQQRSGWQAILNNFKAHVEGSSWAPSGSPTGDRKITAVQKITPFLWYDGQAEQAAQFYVSLFPDSRIDNVARAPADHPSGSAGTILTIEFTLCGSRFVALNGGPQFPFTEAVSFQIACDSQTEVDRLWSALTEGGSEGQCGWLKDRWGLSWQIVPTRLHELLGDPDPGRSRRAMEAMLKMRKLNIAELEQAANGA